MFSQPKKSISEQSLIFEKKNNSKLNETDYIEKSDLENFIENEDKDFLFKKPSNLRVSTYNILTSFSYIPKGNEPFEKYKLSWAFRKDLIVEMIVKSNSDIIGLQEVSIDQINYLKEKIPQFGMVGFAAYTGHSLNDIAPDEYVGEIVPILYNKSKIKCLYEKVSWLSATPNELSKGWDASRPRIVTAAVFLDKSNDIKFVAGNTHYDHLGDQSLVNSGKVEVEQLEKIREEHNATDIIYVGDRNCFTDGGRHGNEWYQTFLKESNALDTRKCGTHIGAGTTFYGYEADEFKAPYQDDKNTFTPSTLDLIFHKSGRYKVKSSQCTSGEYKINKEKNQACLLPFFRRIEAPKERNFASDHALLAADFEPLKLTH